MALSEVEDTETSTDRPLTLKRELYCDTHLYGIDYLKHLNQLLQIENCFPLQGK